MKQLVFTSLLAFSLFFASLLPVYANSSSADEAIGKSAKDEIIKLTENYLSDCSYISLVESRASSGTAARAVGDYIKNELTTSDGYMTYYVQAYNGGNGNFVLSARYEWLIAPAITRTDVFGLGHGSSLVQTSNVTYAFKADILSGYPGNYSQFTYSTSTPTSTYTDSYGSAVNQDLVDAVYSADYMYVPSNQRGFIQYNASFNNASTQSSSAFAKYIHQTVGVSINPSVTFGANGGMSLAAGLTSYFKTMSPNPYMVIYR